MDDVELEARLGAMAVMDGHKWRETYRTKMSEAIDFFNRKVGEPQAKWTPIPSSDPTEPMKLFYQRTRSGYHMLRAEGLLRAPADRVHHLNKDTQWETRRQWDDPSLTYIEKIGSCGGIDAEDDPLIQMVKTHIHIPVPLVWDRFSLGIQWDGELERGEFVTVFRTTEHFSETCPSNMVSIDCISGAHIRPVNASSCYCILIAWVAPNGWLPPTITNMFTEKLRQRLHLYERVAGQDWEKYYPTHYQVRTKPRRPSVENGRRDPGEEEEERTEIQSLK